MATSVVSGENVGWEKDLFNIRVVRGDGYSAIEVENLEGTRVLAAAKTLDTKACCAAGVLREERWACWLPFHSFTAWHCGWMPKAASCVMT